MTPKPLLAKDLVDAVLPLLRRGVTNGFGAASLLG
jgi:hypothetical protein